MLDMHAKEDEHMSFKENLPDYKSYNNGKVYMNVVPSGAWSEFSGLILKAASSDSDFVLILNHFAEIIPCEPAKTWSGSFLGEESQEFVRRIKSKVDKGHFDIFMDCLAVLNTIGQLSKDDVNEFLEDNEIGYRMEMDLFTRKPIWTLKDDATTSVENINEAQNSVIGVSQQAYEEFEMAKKSLQSASDERARKDAVRSCVSAMEAIVKEYGEDNEIGNATKNLKNSDS